MKLFAVAPLAGVWIENDLFQHGFCIHVVAPLAGVWIEKSLLPLPRARKYRRTPRGCVD